MPGTPGAERWNVMFQTVETWRTKNFIGKAGKPFRSALETIRGKNQLTKSLQDGLNHGWNDTQNSFIRQSN